MRRFYLMRKTSIKELAAKANVSVTTVSRVFNGHPHTNAKTAELVKKLARELNYIPKSAGRRQCVAVILADMDENPINNYSGSLLMEIAIYCSKNNLSYQVIPGDGLHLLDEYYMDYAISLTGVLDDISKYTKTKFVFINTIPPGETGVKSDNFTPIKQASEYLFERGRRRQAIVLPDANAVSLKERIAAFEASVKNLGIPREHCAVIELCKMDDFENFSKKMRNFAIDGLIVAGEAMPLQISYFLDLLNLKVPADVSVISYEVEHFSQYLIPPHTTIKQDFKTLVAKAFKMLMSKDAGKRKGDVIVPCSFIERDSVSTKI